MARLLANCLASVDEQPSYDESLRIEHYSIRLRHTGNRIFFTDGCRNYHLSYTCLFDLAHWLKFAAATANTRSAWEELTGCRLVFDQGMLTLESMDDRTPVKLQTADNGLRLRLFLHDLADNAQTWQDEKACLANTTPAEQKQLLLAGGSIIGSAAGGNWFHLALHHEAVLVRRFMVTRAGLVMLGLAIANAEGVQSGMCSSGR